MSKVEASSYLEPLCEEKANHTVSHCSILGEAIDDSSERI